jgi:cell division septation protein DedD
MRNLFLALLLANLAFAAWHTWSKPPRPIRTTDPDVPGITLVSELPEDLTNLETVERDASGAPAQAPAGNTTPDDAVAPAPANAASRLANPAAEDSRGAPEATAASPGCSSVGPFRELAQAATAAANLRAAGYQPSQRVAEGDIWIGYWVYIDAMPNETEANAILAKVRAEGVTDSYVIPNSDSGALVSLGVFSEISGVSRRRDQVRALGFEPKVVDRTRRATVYWVDVTLVAGQTLDFDALQTPGRISRLEQRSCDAPAP